MATATEATLLVSQSVKSLNLFDFLLPIGDDEAKADTSPEKLKIPPSSAGAQSRKRRNKKGGNRRIASEESKEATSSGSEHDNASTRLRMPLVWIDLEMTGLDPSRDRILEIACIITDGRLERLAEGPHLVINQSEELIAGMGEWCTEHHFASGLVEAVRGSRVTEGEAEQQVLEFVRQHCSSDAPPPNLAGNSVHMDYVFLKKYMPELAAYLSHILVDVSSVRSLCIRWFPKENRCAPAKKHHHRALEDIKESIGELAYLRKAIFRNEGQ